VEFARDGAPIERGCIYIAPPDLHLLLRKGSMHLRRGPRENLARPAIDPLFRTAAVSYGPRVIGVVLSGSLRDGSVGLLAIRKCGGLGLVQEPGDADVSEMPESAITWADPDFVAPLGELATIIIQRVSEPALKQTSCPEEIRMEAETAFGMDRPVPMDKVSDKRSYFSCPECNGALWEIKEAGLVRYRCHVGHAFSGEVMLDANGEQLERALWSTLRILEERIELIRTLATRAALSSHRDTEDSYRARIRERRTSSTHPELDATGAYTQGVARRARRGRGLI
jgi:two-component system chemotaxis response regulator CheB